MTSLVVFISALVIHFFILQTHIVSLLLVFAPSPVLDRTNWVASLTLLFVLLLYPALVVALVCFMLWRDAQWKMSTPVLGGFVASLVLVLVFLIVVASTFDPWQVLCLPSSVFIEGCS